MSIAQVSIFLDDSGNVRAEAPGKNGSRQKIDLPLDFAQRNPEIMAELTAQQDKHRARLAAQLRDTQTANIAYVATNHGIGLVRQIWGQDPERIFNQALKRHMKKITGNAHADAERSTGKRGTAKPVAVVPADFDISAI